MPTIRTRTPHAAGGGAPLAVLAVLSLAAAPTPAQPPPGPVLRPTVSPYLNLLQGNSPPVANYYGVVRPVQEFRRQNDQLANRLSTLQTQAVQPGTQTDLPETGHVAGFMNAGGYFRNLGSGPPARGPIGPPTTVAAPLPSGGTRAPTRR